MASDNPPSHVLLTGATGLLGRYLLRDLLLAGVPVAVVVRPNRRQTAAQRVEALMRTWETLLERELPRPHVLEGDICSENFGLTPEDIEWVTRNCDVALHNAASLSFVGGDPEGEPWRSNVGGTRNLLELCRTVDIRKLHYVSTAYVCGLRKDTILESELDVGQTLSNDYEKSKVQAEELVRDAHGQGIDELTIYRPGIIVGDSETGFTTTFHGFYAALRLAHTLRNSVDPSLMSPGNVNLRLTLDGNECKNLVPVDWVSAVIAHIYTHPEHHGKTFHLTPEQPVTMQMIYDALEASCDLRGTAVMHGSDKPLDNPSEVEQLFYENMRIYDSYWRNDPKFDTSNTQAAAPHLPCPLIDEDRLLMLSKTAIAQDFRWKDKAAETADVHA